MNKPAPGLGESLRNLLIFQLKLLADAVRDFLLSPASIAMFLLDIVLRPDANDSYTMRLMRLGRKSDRVIDLFNEHQDEVSSSQSNKNSKQGQQ